MYESIIETLGQYNATLVAVSKTKSPDAIMKVYQKGQRIFGENRVSELIEKQERLPNDISWHMIGHLQSKKVKKIAPFVDLIHSVDSFTLLDRINKEAQKNAREISVLLQFKIAEEDSKYGFELDEVVTHFKNSGPDQWSSIRINGVMGMATFTNNTQQVREEFKRLNHIFCTLKEQFFTDATGFNEISMGMSGDYKVALEEGSTIVRIGSLIFGER